MLVDFEDADGVLCFKSILNFLFLTFLIIYLHSENEDTVSQVVKWPSTITRACCELCRVQGPSRSLVSESSHRAAPDNHSIIWPSVSLTAGVPHLKGALK